MYFGCDSILQNAFSHLFALKSQTVAIVEPKGEIVDVN